MSTLPTSTSPHLDELLCFDLYAASRALTSVYRVVLDDLDLTYPQYLVLTVLWSDGESAIKHLATTLHLDHATLTPLLRRMEAADLVRRRPDPDDHRTVLVVTGRRGDELRASAPDVQRAIGDAMGLADDQVAQLRTLVRDLTRNVERAARARD
ncbi:MAG: MarR family transcriptional regulator [Nocardioidaceae bacterium]|nr:MarR family transcriptional regulator [Nocardioidaceae bacterium]